MTLPLLLLGGGSVTPPPPDFTPVPGEDFWYSGTELGSTFAGLEFDRPFRVGAVGNGRLLITGRIKRNGVGLEQIIWRCKETGEWRVGHGPVSPGEDFWFWTYGEGAAPWRSAVRDSASLENQWVFRSVESSDYPGAPDNLSFPFSAVVVDDFNRDGGLGANWTSETWVGETTPVIFGNTAYADGAFRSAYWNPSTFTADQEAWFESAATGRVILDLRIQTPGTASADAYEVDFNAGTVTARLVTNGAVAGTVFTSSYTDNAGDILGARIVGSTIEAYRNGTLIASGTDGTITGAGYIGLEMASGARANSFGGGSYTSGSFPATALLDNFNRSDTVNLGSQWAGVDPYDLSEPGWRIFDNQAQPVGANAADYWSAPLGPNCEAFVTLGGNFGAGAGILIDFMWTVETPSYAGYGFYVPSSGNWNLHKYAAGVQTNLASGTDLALAPGDTIGLRRLGSTLELWWKPAASTNFAKVGSATDTTNTTGPYYAALWSPGGTALDQLVDNWAVGTIDTDSGLVWSVDEVREVQAVHIEGVVVPRAEAWGSVWMNSPSWWWESTTRRLYVNTGDGVQQSITDPTDLIDDFNRADELSSSRWIPSPRADYRNLRVIGGHGAGSDEGYVWSRPAALGEFSDVIASATIAADFGNDDYLSVFFRANQDTQSGYEVGVYEYGSGQYGIEMYRYDNGAMGAAFGFQTVSQWKAGDRIAVRAIGDQLQAWYYRNATATWTLAFTMTDATYQAGHVGVGMTANVRISEYRAHAVTEPPSNLSAIYDAVYETGLSYQVEVAVVPTGGESATVSGLQHMEWRTEVVNSVDHTIDQSAPSVLAPGTNMQAVYTALAKGIGDLAAAAEDAAFQTLPELATWAISIWESQVGIPSNERIPLEKRVESVMARLTTRGGNRGSFFELVDQIVGTGSLVTDLYSSYRVNIRLPLVDQIRRERAEELIKEIKPLGINVVVSYGSFIAGISVAGDSL